MASKNFKNENSVIEELFIVLSPDRFLINMDFEPLPKKEAEKELKVWVERYKTQGYYSTSNRDIIDFEDIFNACFILSMDEEETQKIYELEKYMLD